MKKSMAALLVLLCITPSKQDARSCASTTGYVIGSSMLLYGLYNLAHYYNKTCIGRLTIVGMVGQNSESYSFEKIHRFIEDSSIKGVLLVIESPGGFAGVSELLEREIALLAKTKPVVALVVNVCCSGAYQIALSADWIVAPAFSTIGSIGVFTTVEKHQNLKVKKDGYSADVKVDVFHAGKFKTTTHPHTESLSPEDSAELQQNIDSIYETFLDKVVERRHVSRDASSDWAEGRVFDGKQALEKGLIDQIGGYSDALLKIKELIIQRGGTVKDKFLLID